MGNLLSFEDDNEGTLTGAAAREQIQQRQRAQVLLLSQLRQEAAGPASLGLQPMQQPSLRQTEVFKNPLHVRAKSVQLSCGSQSEQTGTWQLSFIFDAMVPCEVLVHVGCSERSLPEGEMASDAAESLEYRWVSKPVRFRDGLNQEFRGEVDLGDFMAKAPERADSEFASEGGASGYGGSSGGLRTRMRSQGFCIELKAARRRSNSEGDETSLPQLDSGFAVGVASPGGVGETSALSGSVRSPRSARSCEEGGFTAAEWTKGRFVRRDCSQVNLSAQTAEAQVVEAKILSQSVKLPDNNLASCYSMYEVFGADPTEGGNSAECAICMSERRDTAVLPCRHMCLCSGCAETMRTQIQYHSYRCPICRERVSSLLQKRGDPS